MDQLKEIVEKLKNELSLLQDLELEKNNIQAEIEQFEEKLI